MSPKNNKEIFSIYFKEEERQKVEAEIWKTEESFKEKYEKVKSAQVDIKLDELEENIREKTDDNFEKRFEAFKKAVEKKEAELKTDEWKWLVASTVGKAKEKVKSAFRKKLADTPLIWWLLVKALDWIEDSEKEDENRGLMKNFWLKMLWWIWIAVLSFFWYNKFKESLAWVKGDESWGSESGSTSEVGFTWRGEIDLKRGEITEWQKLDTKLEKTDLKDNLRLIWGFKLLTTLSRKKVDTSYGTDFLDEWFINNETTYEEFLQKWKDDDFKSKFLWKNNKTKDLLVYDKYREAICSNNVNDLLRIWLTSKIVSIILMGRNWDEKNLKLEQELWPVRFEEILTMINNNNFFYKKLRVYELALLYTYTIPTFINWMLLTVATWFSNWVKKLLNLEELRNFDWIEQDFFSEELLGKIASSWWEKEFNEKSKDDLIKEWWINNPKDIEDFNKFYEFKEYIMKGWFLDNTQLWLNDSNYSLLIRKNMNYKWLLALYWVMWWNHLDEINPINIPIVALLIKKIIWQGELINSLTASNYLAKFLKWYFLSNDWDPIVSQDTKRIMEIYGGSLIDVYIISRMRNILAKVWIWIDKKHLLTAWATSLWAWITLNIITNKLAKQALLKWKMPFLFRTLKLTSWAWIIWWIALGTLWVIESTQDWIWDTNDDLEEATKRNDFEKVIEILDRYEESITQIERTNENNEKENVSVISYNNWAPYVVYDGKIYAIALTTARENLLDRALEVFWINKESPWKITYTDWKLQIWNQSFNINGLMSWNWEKRMEWDWSLSKLWFLINDGVKFVSEEYKFNMWQKGTEIIKIWSKWEFDITLLPIWEYKIWE